VIGISDELRSRAARPEAGSNLSEVLSAIGLSMMVGWVCLRATPNIELRNIPLQKDCRQAIPRLTQNSRETAL